MTYSPPRNLITRQWADVELRTSGNGRTLVGIAAPFDAPITLHTKQGTGYHEVIRRGAFARSIAERGPSRVKLLSQHNDRANPIGRASVLREDTRGLYAELRVSQTQAGDEVLELIRDGALDGLSVGFVPVRQNRTDNADGVPLIERTEVKLHEISVVTWPAFDAARIAQVRDVTFLDPSLDHARRRAALAAVLSGAPLE